MLHAKQITIIGTGLLGGSIGLGLRAAGYGGRIIGVGRTPATLQAAVRMGCIHEGTNELRAGLGGSDLVILATPLRQFGKYFEGLAEHASALAAGVVVTDVGSTKGQVCAEARRLLPKAVRFVGSHPMAGSEKHGPAAARRDLFANKPCIVTAERDSDPGAVACVESLWTTLGMRLLRMSPEEHDRKVAFVSHLPHAVAELLVQLAVRKQGLEVASTGFRDTTRIASGDPAVWLDIFCTNAPQLTIAIDALCVELQEFKSLLAPEREPQLLELLTAAKAARDRWRLESFGEEE